MNSFVFHKHQKTLCFLGFFSSQNLLCSHTEDVEAAIWASSPSYNSLQKGGTLSKTLIKQNVSIS